MYSLNYDFVREQIVKVFDFDLLYLQEDYLAIEYDFALQLRF